MFDALTVAGEIEALAAALDRVAPRVGRALDEVAFGGAPPRVVTFEAIDRALHRTITGELPPDEDLEAIRYCDELVVGEDLEEDLELGSEELVIAAADTMRCAADRLRALGVEEAATDVEPVRAMARFIVFHVVVAAQLVGQQLLVVDLADAIDVDALPLPGELGGGATA